MSVRTRPQDFRTRRWENNAPLQKPEQDFSDLSKMVMRKKYNTEGEFFINFFERCNLRCGFCYQKHDDWTGIDTILAKADQLINHAKLLKDRYDSYQVNLMGGELFMDEVPDKAFDEYFEFVKRVSEGLAEIGKGAKFHFVSNMIFEKTERLERLIHRMEEAGYDAPVCVSYDFVGRFNSRTLALFKENVEKFFDKIKMVSVVLTKQNADVLLGRKPEGVATFSYLRELYDRDLYILFDYFSPQHNADVFSPSDEEMYDAFAWLIDNMPKAGPVAEMMDARPRAMTCREDQIVQPDGEIGRCRILVDKRTLDEFESQPHNFKGGNMQGQFVDKMGCLQCEYFDRCGLGCFLLHDYSGRNQMSECLFRKLYQKIEGTAPSNVC